VIEHLSSRRLSALKLMSLCTQLLCAGIAPSGPGDSINPKLPKHYFSTMILLDAYRKPERVLSNSNHRLAPRLNSYGIKQGAVAFYTPLYTSGETGTDLVTSNTHLLLTGNYLSLRPQFTGLSKEHNLVKAGVGMRFIYNTGRKAVWFIDVSPFVTRDVTYNSRAYYRMASSIIYSYNVSERFNWRVGLTKSFLWGNRYYLPFVGIRIGPLDKVHFSLQFPRSIQLNIPAGRSLILSIYSRPQGGMFIFSNADSLYFRGTEATFHFTRYEVNTGLRVDVRATRFFSFYLATGLSTGNNITFYSEAANPRKRSGPYRTYFYASKVPPSGFLNLGLVFSFGKTRSFYKDRNIYDAIDLNRQGNGIDNGNTQIPLPGKSIPKDLNLESIRDLVEESEL
jgi:hypothetical protein